jgi:hypothetical protein
MSLDKRARSKFFRTVIKKYDIGDIYSFLSFD